MSLSVLSQCLIQGSGFSETFYLGAALIKGNAVSVGVATVRSGVLPGP
jgi:hypothetical protein